CENNESMSGYFHAWVASKSLLMDVFCLTEMSPSAYFLTVLQLNPVLRTISESDNPFFSRKCLI
ncbi:hypothetical protein, partial [Geobacillus kaustophilus]|uniref:hypothetical protein n=1 Tax=Geobacillus kaustophilus TaxID=1462 RepID=UPI001C3F30E0